MVLRYLENGDNVIATVRKESSELEALKEQYGDRLYIAMMDIGNTESVLAAKAAEILRKLFEEKWNDKTGPRFITNKGEAYPF